MLYINDYPSVTLLVNHKAPPLSSFSLCRFLSICSHHRRPAEIHHLSPTTAESAPPVHLSAAVELQRCSNHGQTIIQGDDFSDCAVHGFSSWFDVEDPHGWQKTCLLAAWDQIYRQRTQIQKLKSENRVLKQQKSADLTASSDNFDTTQAGSELSEEYQHLRTEMLKARERERLLRQVLLISWGGFLAATAIIITMSKN